MIGILVQLALSWLLAWWLARKDLSILGLRPTKSRLADFALFFAVAAFFSASEFLLKMWIIDQRWHLNPMATPKLIIEGLWWNIKSVMFEELIFRGVLFYLLIKKLGTSKAILISSIAFGIYLWFSQGLWGQPIPMLYMFVASGLMGGVYAYGYAKTYSLYVPIAIHLGWNAMRSVVFSGTSIGDQLLVLNKPVPEVTVSYPVFFLLLLFHMVGVMLTCFWLLKIRRQEPSQ
jgi:uncharacterized protein